MTPSLFIPSWLYVQLWSDQLFFALEKKSGNYLSLLNMCQPSDSAVCTTLVPLYASLLHSISDPIVPGRSSDISHCRETHHYIDYIMYNNNMSYNRYCVRAAPKFGKHVSLFAYHL